MRISDWSSDVCSSDLDWDLFLRLAAGDGLGFIDASVCAYRIHGANLSRRRHIRSRVCNLAESRQVALRRACLFDEPYQPLLRAQAHYIGAKISFLQRQPWSLAMHLLAYLWLMLLSKLRPPSAHHGAEAT